MEPFEGKLLELVESPADCVALLPVFSRWQPVKAARAQLRRQPAAAGMTADHHRDEALLMRVLGRESDDATPEHAWSQQRQEPLTAAQKGHLLQRYGWFARLALGRRDPAARQQAEQRAVRVAVVNATLAAAGLLGAFLGLVLLGLMAVGFHTRVLRRHYPDVLQTCWREPTAYLEAVVIMFLTLFAFALVAGYLPAVLRLPAQLLVPLAGGGWLVLRGGSALPPTAPAHGSRVRRLLREGACGLLGYVAGLPLLFLGLLLTARLRQLVTRAGWDEVVPTPAHPAVEQMRDAGALQMTVMIVGAVVIAPLLEEYIFRGLLYHHLRQRHRAWLAGMIAAFVFAALHPQSLLGIPVLMAIGFTMAMIREWRGSLTAPVVAHACNNLCVMVPLLIFEL